MSRKYFGHAGHLCVSSACLHHIHTHVGGHCVSTVGDYYPNYLRKGDTLGKRETVGSGRFFETFVFPLGPDGECGHTFCEMDSNCYQTKEEADAGHEALCLKYEATPSEGVDR
jgi:hypothetical protein